MIPQGTGSGFVWDSAGHVITNFHVVKGANAIKVTLYDSTSCSAKVVGVDENKDIAVLQLDIDTARAAALRKVELGRSTGLFVGQQVYAIGNPFGLDHTLTSVRAHHTCHDWMFPCSCHIWDGCHTSKVYICRKLHVPHVQAASAKFACSTC